MIKNFSCFKVKEKTNPKAPDYRLSAKIGDKYVPIGAGWVADGPQGKYISFLLSKPYNGQPGFEITIAGNEGAPTPQTIEYPENKGEEIPF